MFVGIHSLGLRERAGAQEAKTALSLQQAAIGRSAADVGLLCSLNKAGNSTARLVCRTPELRHRKCMGAKAASSLQQAAIGRRSVSSVVCAALIRPGT